jgi:hypothetical protein
MLGVAKKFFWPDPSKYVPQIEKFVIETRLNQAADCQIYQKIRPLYRTSKGKIKNLYFIHSIFGSANQDPTLIF